jgi:phosphoribosylglycinamide formyltransferase 1
VKRRVGVLVSGSGSNLQALIDACRSEDYPAQVAVVISNVPTAYALQRARAAAIPAETVDHKGFADRELFEQKLLEVLAAHRVEVLCLAGFMRLLGGKVLSAYPGRVLNIHPSLLPAFPGLHGARQALHYGAKITGCTVHFVDEGLDCGPVIVQAAVPVLPEDDEAALAARILAEEHRIYPLALRWLCEQRLAVEGRKVRLAALPVAEDGVLRSPGRLA